MKEILEKLEQFKKMQNNFIRGLQETSNTSSYERNMLLGSLDYESNLFFDNLIKLVQEHECNP